MANRLDTYTDKFKCQGDIMDSHQKTAKCSLCNEKNTGILKEFFDPFQQQRDPALPPPGRAAFSGANEKSYDSLGARFAKEAFVAPRRTLREPTKRILAKLDPVPAHLEGKTTVIVGGGVMGLCIAYHLAALSQSEVKRPGHNTGIKHTIIVIDELDQPFYAGSGTNSGRLSVAQLSEDLKQLGEVSYEQWEELGSKREFREQTAYCGGSLLHLECVSGRQSGGFDVAPEWLKLYKEDLVSYDPPNRRGASVDPVQLGKWLVGQCSNRGVTFRIGTRIITANHSADCNLESVTLETIKAQREYAIPCDNLVIAAGTWSELLFNRLFPDSSIALPSSKIRAADWMLVANPEPTSQGNLSVGGVKSVGLEFASRTDGKIWVAAVAEGAIRQPQPRQLYTLYPQTFGRLKRHAADLIVPPRDTAAKAGPLAKDTALTSTKPEQLAKGTAFTATMTDGNPVMAKIGSDQLWVLPQSKNTKQNALGVFLCYGHGVNGLTLGMGCGKIMADMIRDVQPAIDVSKFDVRPASQAGGVAPESGHAGQQLSARPRAGQAPHTQGKPAPTLQRPASVALVTKRNGEATSNSRASKGHSKRPKRTSEPVASPRAAAVIPPTLSCERLTSPGHVSTLPPTHPFLVGPAPRHPLDAHYTAPYVGQTPHGEIGRAEAPESAMRSTVNMRFD
ncbi:hypothetical protein B0A49_00371 [Cryomyces minteri]|uniref:FAD dependent oxidoreductase domain-containing protein n=1 Tax=Cryomyces minteri TaxID=331657 RepID=A0A4U0Y2T7_9PEZI|nr:hypothetical protein B0A49_00371 [Cryomyces minteri]